MMVVLGVAMILLMLLIAKVYNSILPMMRLPMMPDLFTTSPSAGQSFYDGDSEISSSQPYVNVGSPLARPLGLLLQPRSRTVDTIDATPPAQQMRAPEKVYATFAAGLKADESLHYSNLD